MGVTSAFDPSSGNVFSGETAGMGLNQIIEGNVGSEFEYGQNLTGQMLKIIGAPFMGGLVITEFEAKQTFL